MRRDRLRFSKGQLIVLYLGIIFLPTELRFGNALLSLSVPEIVTLILALSIAIDAMSGRPAYVPGKPILLMSAFMVAAAISLLISDDLGKSVQALRNIASIFLFIVILLARSLSPDQLDGLYRAFLASALVCALIGIWQSAVGVAAAVSISDFSYMGYEQADRLSEIMAWKLNNINSADLIEGQKSVGIGLSSYSNNFGEMLVYAWIACISLYFRKVNGVVVTALAMMVLVAAVVSSASRSAMLGFAAAALLLVLMSANKSRRLIMISLIIPAVLSLFAVDVWREFFGYDNYGTLLGRVNLNTDAIDFMFSSVPAFLFGGVKVGEYYAMNTFSPHNMLLYISLFYGVIGLMLFVALGAWIVMRIRRQSMSLPGERKGPRAFYWAAVAGSCWFAAYGMTWSIVESANSGILAAFIVVGALSSMGDCIRRFPSPNTGFRVDGV